MVDLRRLTYFLDNGVFAASFSVDSGAKPSDFDCALQAAIEAFVSEVGM
jgi:hypothetical protein